jgi:membrane fusion protein (multidrug efflux system)
LGIRQAGRVEIVTGLTAGESIVTEGVIKMRPGVQVRLAGDKTERHAEQGGGRPPGTFNPRTTNN